MFLIEPKSLNLLSLIGGNIVFCGVERYIVKLVGRLESHLLCKLNHCIVGVGTEHSL